MFQLASKHIHGAEKVFELFVASSLLDGVSFSLDLRLFVLGSGLGFLSRPGGLLVHGANHPATVRRGHASSCRVVQQRSRWVLRSQVSARSGW